MRIEHLEPRCLLSASPTNADLIYDSTTGNVLLDSSEAAGALISNFVLKNNGADFALVTNSFPEELSGSPRSVASVTTSSEISWTDLNILSSAVWNVAPGSGQALDLGEVFPVGLSEAELSSLLSQQSYVGLPGSGVQEFDLIVSTSTPNQPPSFSVGADQIVNEDAGMQNIAAWATGISPGAANEAGQSLEFLVTDNSNSGLFSSGPTVDPVTGDLSYTPAMNAFGSAEITLALKDDGGTHSGGSDTSDSQSFTIEIISLNDAPSFTKGSNPSVGENVGPQLIPSWATNISIGAENESEQVLIFQITSNSNPALFAAAPVVDSTTGNLSFTPAVDAFGTATITLVLQDDGPTGNGESNTSSPQEFAIAVNHTNAAPELDVIVEQASDEGMPLVFNGNFTDANSEDTHTAIIHWGDGSPPEGLTLVEPNGGNSGSITGTHVYADNGDYSANVVVTDNFGAESNQSFLVSVSNLDPTITSSSVPNNGTEGENLDFIVSASDPASVNDPLVYTWGVSGSGGLIDILKGAFVQFVPPQDDSYNIQLSVSDGDGGLATQSFSLNVSNGLPSVTSDDATVNVDEGEQATNSGLWSDPGDDEVSLSASVGTITKNDDGTWDWSFDSIDGPDDSREVTITADDGDGGEATSTFNLTVNNVSPIITSSDVPDFGVKGQTLNLSASALDPAGSGDPTAFSWMITRPDSTTATLFGDSVSFSSLQDGSHEVILSVSDDDGGLTTQSFMIAIGNHPPIAGSDMTVSISEESGNGTFVAVATATDQDLPDDTLTFSISGGNPNNGFTIQSATGRITIDDASVLDLDLDDGSSFVTTLEVTVSDGTDSDTQEITVLLSPINDHSPVAAPNRTVRIDEESTTGTLVAVATATDADLPGDTLQYGIASGNPFEGFVIDSLDGEIRLQNPNVLDLDIDDGTDFVASLEITVSDGENTDSQTINVRLNPIDDPPRVIGQLPLSTLEETPLEIELSRLFVQDPDSPFPAGFSLEILPGSNYSHSGNEITPETDFNGELSVMTSVNDGSSSSDVFPVVVTVSAVNDAPEITGQKFVSTMQNQSRTINLNDLNVFDPDNVFPDDFTLEVQDGANYARSGNIITPELDYVGSLVVPVLVNDGIQNSNLFNLNVLVDPSLVPPVVNLPNSFEVEQNTDAEIPQVFISNITDSMGIVSLSLSVEQGSLSVSADNLLVSFFEGDGTQDSQMSFRGRVSWINAALSTLVYHGDASFLGTDLITVSATVEDEAGILDPLNDMESLEITVQPPGSSAAFQVTEFNATSSGFDARFNRAVDQSDLNLYLGDSDVQVVGERVGAVQGSLTIHADGTQLSFIKTGGLLESDTYHVRLVSGSSAIHDFSGNLLDGDGDNLPGGDFETVMNVDREDSPTLTLPDFARGPNQPVAVPADSPGLPIILDDAKEIVGVNFELRYDPSQLDISAVGPSLQLPADWSVNSNVDSMVEPGLLSISAFGFTPISGRNVEIVSITAEVPEEASLAKSHVLHVEEVLLRDNQGIIESQGDRAVHLASFLGDADGDAFFTGFDASLVASIVVGLKDGLALNPSVDPTIIGNVTGNGFLNGLDAAWIAQKSVGLPRPEVPEIPTANPIFAELSDEISVVHQLAAARREVNEVSIIPESSEAESSGLAIEYAGEEGNLTGDINGDHDLNAQDIDVLFGLSGQLPTEETDLNSDGVINSLDVDVLVNEILNSEYGDADLDGTIDDADFNSVLGSFAANGSGWSGGDFNGDGLTDNSDFGILLGNFGFEATAAQVTLTIEADETNHTWQAFAEVTNPAGALGIASFQINVFAVGSLSVLDNTTLETGSTFPLFASAGSFGLDIHASQDTISNGGKGGFSVDDAFALNSRELLAAGEFLGSDGALLIEARSLGAGLTGFILFSSPVDFQTVIQSDFAETVQSGFVTVTA